MIVQKEGNVNRKQNNGQITERDRGWEEKSSKICLDLKYGEWEKFEKRE